MLSGAGLLIGGCASAHTAREMDLFLRTVPIPVLVQKGREFKAAENAADDRRGDIVLSGKGSSMEPLYSEGTAIVVSPLRYGQLRRGMAVVYVNRRGLYVAHVLVGKKARGWIAIGPNNPAPDRDFVTPENLVGVVTQAYSSSASAFRQQWLANLVRQETAAGLRLAELR